LRMSNRDSVEILRSLRATGLRESHRTAHIADEVLKKGGLNEAERWAVTEQLCVALLDCGRHDEAKDVLELIAERFPASKFVKTRRLEAYAAEARGNIKAAGDIYAELIGEPLDDGGANADLVALKRRAAMIRSSGDYVAAAGELNKILKIAMCDTETWLELADVYLRVNNLPYAAYCFEEVLLAMPWNYRVWTRAAETWYSAGEYLLARKYFAYAVELSRGSDEKQYASHVDPRALVGLCMACRAVSAAPDKYAKDAAAVNKDTYTWASRLLLEVIPKASSLACDDD